MTKLDLIREEYSRTGTIDKYDIWWLFNTLEKIGTIAFDYRGPEQKLVNTIMLVITEGLTPEDVRKCNEQTKPEKK